MGVQNDSRDGEFLSIHPSPLRLRAPSNLRIP